MEQAVDGLCPQDRLDAVIAQLEGDDAGGLARLEELLRSWPLDPRLHFLQGSVLAGVQRYDQGRRAMARAVEIAPEFTLARFQLGFLDFASGRALDAVAVWTPLMTLAEDAALRVLAEGLTHLAADHFDEARRLLRKGMTLNQEHPLINADMQLILEEIAGLSGAAPRDARQPGSSDESEEERAAASAVDLLLRQSQLRGGGTRH